MKLEINIDPSCTEPRMVIHTDRMTEEIEALARRLTDTPPETIAAQSESSVVILPVAGILRIYSERQKVYAQTADGVYTLRARLYEMENRLEGTPFVRISSSELVNSRMITGMDFSLAGTIRLSLRGGITTYVARRHVSRIKKLFEV